MKTAVSDLQRFQANVAKALLAVCVIHVPVLGLVAFARDAHPVEVTIAALALTLVPVVLALISRATTVLPFGLSVALVGHVSLLVYIFSGHPWQTEMHFYYFVVLAMLSGFCGWRTMTFAAALTAVDHVLLEILAPHALHGGSADPARIAIHILFVVIETAMLIGIGLIIGRSLARAQESSRAASIAASELQRLVTLRERELRESTSRAGETRVLLDAFEQEVAQSIEALHRASTIMLSNADQIGASAERSSAQAVTVASAAEETARKVELAAAAGEQLSATISEVGASAARSSKLAASAVDQALHTSATIDEMATVAQEIVKVTDLITGIAAQTNLLALNATIEAARAGEAGRGFSIVAQEVKALANQTTSATADIAKRIASMQDATSRSVKAIQEVSSRIRELDQFSSRIADAVEQQAAATREIAGNVAHAATSVGDVERSLAEIETIAQSNTQSVAKMSSSAKDVASHTSIVRDRIQIFTQDLARLRA